MNTDTQQTTTTESTTTWRALTPTLWRIYFVYLIVWLPSLILTGYAIREERSSLIGWGLLGLGISVVIYLVCMVYAGRIQGSLHREGLSKSGVAPIVIAAFVLNPIFGGFYVPLSVLLSARKAAHVAAFMVIGILGVGICGCSRQEADSGSKIIASKEVRSKLPFTFEADFKTIIETDSEGRRKASTPEIQALACDGIPIELAETCVAAPGPIRTKQFGSFQIVTVTNGQQIALEFHGTPAQREALTKYVDEHRQKK